MNILMFTNTYFPIMGGLEKSIYSFSEEFRKRSNKVLIVSPEFKEAPKKQYGVVRVPAIQNFNGTDFSVSIPVPGLVSDLMTSFKPDIIHAHHPFLMGDMALRLAGQSGLPLVFTYHTLFEQYSDFLLSTDSGKKFVIELATGFSNLADYVIAPSNSVKKILKDQGVTTPIEVIPTGVDVQRFAKGNGKKIRRKFKIPKNAFVAGYIGRIAAEKNLPFLGEAVAAFLKQLPQAHFLVVGKGPVLKDFKKIFAAQKLLPQVHFAGILKGKDLIDAYHAMDVFVFASQSETQGMVVTEAMASGLPVIAVDATGVREVVRDRVNGRLLAKENVKLFSDALLWLMKQPKQKRIRLKKSALATAEKFSMEKSAAKALALYNKVRIRKKKENKIEGSPWESVMGRIKTEWEMLANLGKAAGAAIVEAAIPASPPAHSELIEETNNK